MLITSVRHPQYTQKLLDWEKYRKILTGGQDFINEYLHKTSRFENPTDFETRKTLTYVPGYAKSVIREICNAINRKMADVIRQNGTITYQDCSDGLYGGVDLKGMTMNAFIGDMVLMELVGLGKVGIGIDRAKDIGMTKLSNRENHPYLTVCKAEDIVSWKKNQYGELLGLLVKAEEDDFDPEFSLINKYKTTYYYYEKTGSGIDVRVFNTQGIETESKRTLNLSRIPYIIPELPLSLLSDVADHQIALLNICSSDIMWILNANITFYTEQFDAAADMVFNRSADHESTSPGIAEASKVASNKQVQSGPFKGRGYPRGVDRPGFINPSSEPLEASMLKQEKIQQEIRQLIGLNVSKISLQQSSKESKEFDEKGLEAGLIQIADYLEVTEREIANIWAEFEGEKITKFAIKYPKDFSLQSISERIKESNDLLDVQERIPSKAFQKKIAKDIAHKLIGSKITREEYTIISNEIDEAIIVTTNPEIIQKDHEAGLVSDNTASKIRGYPEGEAEKAQKDHAERLARIAASQATNNANRGIPDQKTDNTSGEKLISQNADVSGTGTKSVRGAE